MLLRRVALENVRSFLQRAELNLDGNVSILIGPNGGGKTNLLDAIVIMLRRHLFASMYAVNVPTPEEPNRHEFRYNDALNQLILEKHSAASDLPQLLEVEVEVTRRDLDSMLTIKHDSERILELASKKYVNLRYREAAEWNVDQIVSGQRFTYRLADGSVEHGTPGPESTQFLQFLQMAEIDSQLREEYDLAALSTPMVYLPVNRAANAISSSIELAGYNAFESKRQSDATISRTQFSLVQVAIGRLAQRYRLLLEKDTGTAAKEFRADENLQELTKILTRLGYEWDLVSTAPLRNAYDVQLSKQGTSFVVSRASSGERELLTYLFTIFALNVRDALIIVDEPELHLHPKWQAILLDLFEELTDKTGNQFLLATHSPTFVSPKSIQYVSRVFAENQESQIVRLEVGGLPDGKHLFNIVNSQNNERIFFADKVLLVEGLSDRIFFEAALNRLGLPDTGLILEIISVGGKGLFSAYQSLLQASRVSYAILADLDYIEQIGSAELQSLFKVNDREIKEDVLENIRSKDAAALVAEIEKAISTGSWAGAEQTWEYIKSRRRQLSQDLSDEQEKKLDRFIQTAAAEQVFLLRRGSLEAYLPPGFAGKDIDKLIRFVSDDSFWAAMDEDPRLELEEILRRVSKAA
ncbi:MAG: AAA family ATPase [Alphaproteobacteria bacterium]